MFYIKITNTGEEFAYFNDDFDALSFENIADEFESDIELFTVSGLENIYRLETHSWDNEWDM